VNFSKYPTVTICRKCVALVGGCECFQPDFGLAYLVPVRDTPPPQPCYAKHDTTPCDCTSYCGDDLGTVERWKVLSKTHSKK